LTHVVIVGGGPAGLAAAYRLSRASVSSVTVHLVERAPRPGGLAAGFQHGAYTLDFGPHRLHTAVHPAVLADLRELLGDSLDLKRRRGRIRLGGRYLPYPVGPRTLVGLGGGRLARLLVGFAAAKLSSHPTAASYEAAIVGRLGRPLYDEFYAPYAEKVWGRPGGDIDVEQADRRVNQRGLADLLRLAVGRGPGRSYFYPRQGFGRIPAAYAEALAKRPSVQLDCSTLVERIAWHERRAVGLTWRTDAATSSAPLDHLVWSAPLPELIRRLDPPPPADVAAAAAHLRYRALVLVYVVLDRERVGMADTYYFPEPQFPFNRVIEQKNFSPAMTPSGQTVLGLDIACDAQDATFSASDDDLQAWLVPHLERAGLARRQDVREVFSRRFRAAYPVYVRGSAERFARVMAWLEPLDNLWLIGRQGLRLHNNTHHSLVMGYRAADAILEDGRSRWSAELADFATFRVAD
jgi:protoporphyrinogen oxidase